MILKTSKQLIIVISSPSGAGKTSICKRLLTEDSQLKLSISDTTRPARDNELDGIDYNFIDIDEFKKRIKRDEYIEYAKVFENYYGSPIRNIKEYSKKGKDILFDIDWQGAEQLKKSNYGNILLIFVTPPSKDVIFERLKLRAKDSGDNENAIINRMKMFETEMSRKNEYDFIVNNDNFEKCIKKIKDLINNARAKIIN